MNRTRPPLAVSALLQTLATLTLVVFILHALRTVFIPIALAVLGTFILTPIVSIVEGTGLKRAPATVVTLVITAVMMTGFGWVVMSQVNDLATTLPQHRKEIKSKIAQLSSSGGPISAVLDFARDVTSGRAASAPEKASGPTPSNAPVVVAKVEDSSDLATLAEFALSFIEPLASAALVFVLVAFMLIGREDVRDRVLGVAGTQLLLRTTRVLTDSATGVSRYLLFQLIVNAGFGTLLTLGLLVLHVPYAPLWGALGAVLRFVPYVGTWASFVFPFAMSFATSTGWMQPLWVFLFFLALEMLTANAIEPLLFGHHIGVSPIALLLAAAVWAWIWGPVGLVLSTPITVCLAVLGQHFPKLRPLALLLSDQPALSPPVQYYQRALSQDKSGALLVVEEAIKSSNEAQLFDSVILPALMMAARDRKSERLTIEEFEGVVQLTGVVLTALAEQFAAKIKRDGPAESARTEVHTVARSEVIGIPAHGETDALSVQMLGQALQSHGIPMATASMHLLPSQIEDMISASAPRAIAISIVPPGGVPQGTYLCRRVRKRFPDLPIFVVYHGAPKNYDTLLVRFRRAGATQVSTSTVQTCARLQTLLGVNEHPTESGVEGHAAAN